MKTQDRSMHRQLHRPEPASRVRPPVRGGDGGRTPLGEPARWLCEDARKIRCDTRFILV